MIKRETVMEIRELFRELSLGLAIILIGGILALLWMLSNPERQNYE